MKVHDIDILIGKNLRRIRSLKNLSQEQLGQLINNPPSKISALENSKEGMGKDLMTKICIALKIRPAEFYIEPETPIIENQDELEIIKIYREAKTFKKDDYAKTFLRLIVKEEKEKQAQPIQIVKQPFTSNQASKKQYTPIGRILTNMQGEIKEEIRKLKGEPDVTPEHIKQIKKRHDSRTKKKRKRLA